MVTGTVYGLNGCYVDEWTRGFGGTSYLKCLGPGMTAVGGVMTGVISNMGYAAGSISNTALAADSVNTTNVLDHTLTTNDLSTNALAWIQSLNTDSFTNTAYWFAVNVKTGTTFRVPMTGWTVATTQQWTKIGRAHV